MVEARRSRRVGRELAFVTGIDGRWLRLAAYAGALLAVACGGKPRPAPSTPSPGPTAKKPPQHLNPAVPGEGFTPLAYTVNLVLDPESPTYVGTVTIDLEVARSIDVLAVHAEGLHIERAR